MYLFYCNDYKAKINPIKKSAEKAYGKIKNTFNEHDGDNAKFIEKIGMQIREYK